MKKFKIIATNIVIALLIFLASVKIGFMIEEGNLYGIVEFTKGIVTAIGILIVSVYGFGIVIGKLTVLLSLISLRFGLTTIPNILSFIRTFKIFLTSVIIGVLISASCFLASSMFVNIILSIAEYIFDVDSVLDATKEKAKQDESGEVNFIIDIPFMFIFLVVIPIIIIKKAYGLLDGHKYMWQGFKQNRKKFLKMFVEFFAIHLCSFFCISLPSLLLLCCSPIINNIWLLVMSVK